MGQEFDDNGKYIGWSNLFDYSSIDTLKASQRLPLPTNTTFIKADSGIDITNNIKAIEAAANKAEKIRLEAELLVQLEDKISYNSQTKQLTTYVTWDTDVDGTNVLEDLNTHSHTKLNTSNLEYILRNIVSYNIQDIIQDLRNMDMAYSPVTMNIMHQAADVSPLGSMAKTISLFNPLSKFRMQEENMVGKQVIGIAAVGEKVFFNVSWYCNEGLRSKNPTWLDNMKFRHIYNRIQGRFDKNMTTKVADHIANINYEGCLDALKILTELGHRQLELMVKYGFTEDTLKIAKDDDPNYIAYETEFKELVDSYRSDTYADDLISQLLSAATDNAKELILAKINCNTDLAKDYIHLIMMEFDMKDIVSFMTSPAVQAVVALSKGNMYDEYIYESKVWQAVNILKGNFPVSKFFPGTITDYETGRTISAADAATSDLEALKKVLHKFPIGLIASNEKDNNGNPVMKPKGYYKLKELLADYWEAWRKGEDVKPLSEYFDTKNQENPTIRALLNLSDYIEYVKTLIPKDKVEDFFNDLHEFEEVDKQAEEVSTLGSSLLSFNQGMPVKPESMLYKFYNINKILMRRMSELDLLDFNKHPIKDKAFIKRLVAYSGKDSETVSNIVQTAKNFDLIERFDFARWVANEPGYRKATSDFYNLIKNTWNIFDIIDKLPHYHAIWKILSTTHHVFEINIKRFNMVQLMLQDIYQHYPYSNITEDQIKNLGKYADDLIGLRFFKKGNYQLPIFTQYTKLDKNFTPVTYKEDYPELLSLDTESNRATFKKIMEEQILPQLQAGSYKDIQLDSNNNIVLDKNGHPKMIEKTITDNAFIKNLIIDFQNDGSPFIRLNLDMQNIDTTPSNSKLYQDCLTDLLKLRAYTLNGIPLSDWFMLYNYMINKNQYGSDRMTTIFNEFIDMITDDSAITQILRTTGKFDYNEDPNDQIQSIDDLKLFGYTTKDALYRIAPTISKYAEGSTTFPMVIEVERGQKVIKIRSYGQYQNSISLIPNNNRVDNPLGYLAAYQSFVDHAPYKMPFFAKDEINRTQLASKNIQEVAEALFTYMSRGQIILKYDC